MLFNQPVVYPTSGMPLLFRLVFVSLYPGINGLQIGFKHRKGLMLSLLIPPRLSPNSLLDCVARMTGHP
jgi:hypothetical protein